MTLKCINKLLGRKEQTTQSMIQPNDTLNVKNISQYTQIITNKEIMGYKGLKRAFNEKLEVCLVVLTENGDHTSVKGVISHYDEKFEQLLLVAGSNLKRIVFNQIVEVKVEDEDKDNEK